MVAGNNVIQSLGVIDQIQAAIKSLYSSHLLVVNGRLLGSVVIFYYQFATRKKDTLAPASFCLLIVCQVKM
jgi:hypothetical protein